MMSSETINVGVVGLGFMGATHLAAYQAAAAAGVPCKVAAVCDSNPERLSGKITVAGNLRSGGNEVMFDPEQVRTYDSPEAFFADPDVHLVSICTRTDAHVPLAEAAMRAGKHVLLEKPVAVTAEPVRHLAKLAAECGVCCMPAMCMRFWPAWMVLKEAVEQNRYGPVRSARFTRLGSRPGWSDFYADPNVSGGALVDLHVHDTDFITHLWGRPAHVYSTGTLNQVTTIYGYPDVPHVVAEGGWDQQAGFGFAMRFIVNFERATLDFDIARDPQLYLSREDKREAVTLSPLNGYDGEIRHLISSLQANRRPSLSLEDAVTTHEVLDAERRSIETGAAVQL